ncbi:MAG: hypothetical protein ACL7BU_13880 [Candidatus Phlomobacter fragariae]
MSSSIQIPKNYPHLANHRVGKPSFTVSKIEGHMNPYAMQDYWYEQQQEVAYWEDRLDEQISELVQPVYNYLPSSVMRKLNNED